jgi:glutaminase
MNRSGDLNLMGHYLNTVTLVCDCGVGSLVEAVNPLTMIIMRFSH